MTPVARDRDEAGTSRRVVALELYLSPQVATVPSLHNPTLCHQPHAIATKPAPVGASLRWKSDLFPQVATVPSLRNPTLWTS
eukprot:CAMPEP_0118917082 /NCGR_PEP_ID=MMETSP1166-20130328/17012_1 /TAXON_ID=1104430 /ORGANISM="Chrysoreinhardia sp, Strain CCMP3193" /LENGTH=81 /DNA_ID=CAMNT_0006857123 /DNA_START=91 /DNA_END=333 /DNA_ORIENTATION=+